MIKLVKSTGVSTSIIFQWGIKISNNQLCNIFGFAFCFILVQRSNCDSSAANELRKHYKIPYFLPDTSESSKTDWVFMGCPGYGAHLHVSGC